MSSAPEQSHLARLLRTYDEIVQAACVAPENRFGAAFYREHIVLVADFSRALAEPLSADLDVVLPAALLHDLAAVRDYGTLARHAEAGAELAAGILAQTDYPASMISRVCNCIACHSSPARAEDDPAEIVCLSCADAIAQMARPAYWLHYAYCVKGLGFERGVAWYRDLVQQRFPALPPAAQKLAAPMLELACKVVAPS